MFGAHPIVRRKRDVYLPTARPVRFDNAALCLAARDGGGAQHPCASERHPRGSADPRPAPAPDVLVYEELTVTRPSNDKGVDVVARIQLGISEVREVVLWQLDPTALASGEDE